MKTLIGCAFVSLCFLACGGEAAPAPQPEATDTVEEALTACGNFVGGPTSYCAAKCPLRFPGCSIGVAVRGIGGSAGNSYCYCYKP